MTTDHQIKLKIKELEKQRTEVAQSNIRDTFGLPPNRPTLGELRKRLGISQKDIAATLGVSTNYYSSCERGINSINPGLHILIELLCQRLYK